METLKNNSEHIIEVLESLIEDIIHMDILSAETKQIKEAFVQKAFILEYSQRVNLRDTIISMAKSHSGKQKMQAYELAASLYSNKVEYEVIS